MLNHQLERRPIGDVSIRTINHMHQIVNDPVDVTVQFTGKQVRPILVRWSKNDYPITQVNLVHPSRHGTKMLYYFSVSDATNFMKLQLDTELLEWRIVEFYTE